MTLRQTPFHVGAIPVEFAWDFGDGSEPLVTSDPGQPWPDHTISHIYRERGTVTPVLTTKWKGVFRTGATGTWNEIPGTGETITTGTSIAVYAPRTRLVDEPLS